MCLSVTISPSLCTPSVSSRHELAGEERILAERLEVAAGGRERDLVDHRRVEDVLVRRPTLAADHDAVERSPRSRSNVAVRPDRRRQCRLLMAQANAGGTVGLAQRRDAEALDAVVDTRLADAARDERRCRSRRD